MRFLSSMPAGWNISLFHYRNQGADYGRILVGIQVPPADKARFASSCEAWPTLARTKPTIRPTGSSCLKARSMPVPAPRHHPIANVPLEQALLRSLQRRSEATGSMGELEPLAVQLGLIQNSLKPAFDAPQIVVFAVITDLRSTASEATSAARPANWCARC